jgi:expansin (peptidoglycan-binding protein)
MRLRTRELMALGLLALVVACTGELVSPHGERPAADRWQGEGPPPDGPAPAREQQGAGPDTGAPAVDRGGSTKPDQAQPPLNPFPVISGKATYYDATGAGNCSFEPTGDLMVGAMNQVDYKGSEACGACVKVIGPPPKSATITIRIVDRCPECPSGHIDLSKEAFAAIAEMSLGVVPITWQYVPCNVSGPIAYKFKEGSNEWWTAIQLRNTRYAVKSLEGKIGGTFVALPRETYNYFVYSSGLGPGPYELRVTDVLGHKLTDTNIPFKVGQVVAGAAQFPP